MYFSLPGRRADNSSHSPRGRGFGDGKPVVCHDGYAKGMRKYGWQRGVYVAEASHTLPPRYYRDWRRQAGELAI